MNLEKQTSTNNIDFMERSVLNQFAPNNDRGAMLWGVPRDGLTHTYALAVSAGEGVNRNEKDSRVDNVEWLGRGTVNFAQLMRNKEAVTHLGGAMSRTGLSKTSSAATNDTNLLAGANSVRTEGRGVTYFTFPTLVAVAGVDNSVQRSRYAIEAAGAYGTSCNAFPAA